MGRLSMFSYSWDLEENGVSQSINEFREIGINSITLASSYHAGKFLRPKGKNGKIYFPEDGTTYFASDPSRYGSIKPIPNSIFGNGNVLQELTEIKNFSVNAWLVLFHNSRLGSKNLDSTVRNAFGDPYIYALCPSAPEARNYAIGLTSDLTDNYDVSGISLESIGFPPYEHGYHHEMSFVKPNKWLTSYLGLCFCEYCVNGAEQSGIDAMGLKAKVAWNIDAYLSGEIDFPDDMAEAFWLADVAEDADLHEYLVFRSSVVTSLATEIRARVRKEVEVAIIPSVARPTGGAWYEGADLSALAKVTGVIEACFYESSIDRIKADLADTKRRIGGNGKIKGILRPAFPDLINEKAVFDAVQALHEGGVEDIGFYNYGHIRSQSLNWIANALASVVGK
ncbi:MAG TPA: hypothetical protein VMW30_08420 [Candidatus Paceibacterota bacterium]|nr:hypothetical protein [Candidatus Paceibacterota bacterium]